MKKVLSLLVTLALVMGIAVTSFAADPVAISLGADSTGAVLGADLLTPGKEYRFPLMIKDADDAAARAFTDADLENHILRVTNTEGAKSLTTFKYSKINGTYYMVVIVKAGWPTEKTDEAYTVKYVQRLTGVVEATLSTEFTTGYEVADQALIDTLEAGEYINVDASRPVYTEEQLTQIAKLNNYKKVTFTDGSWYYTANVTDMNDTNLLNNETGIKDILVKYEDNEFKFLSFPAGTKFVGSATMDVDVMDIAEDFNDTFFVYRYLDGKLTLITSTFDADEVVLSFSTNQLGRFVITDKAIKDLVVVPGAASSSSSSSSSSGSDKPNVNTGAEVGNIAGAMAMLSVVAIAAMISKKK